MTIKAKLRAAIIWGLTVAVPAAALWFAATSPLLAWRDPVYVAAGLAGVVALVLLFLQPLLAAGRLPGLSPYKSRRIHRWTGACVLLAVLIHVAGLWITSPPDVVDVLLFRSPAPFSIWGAVAMWAVFATATLALLRGRLPLRPRMWRRLHTTLALMSVIGTAGHAVQIEGTMETVSKAVLCGLAVGAAFFAVLDLRIWARKPRREPLPLRALKK
ncbi:ferric reductase [Roseibium aquae]|uniref:Ferric reductase n=1 Tax=Roseibium aquae TaxID=1323746 RepID=A0A916TFT3_9HYPH|nr:ferric reductase-like transmembrane domain-containing protein [Roseibium aquae]GGB43254.1 ferric reductase [Roseibium aquae]